MVNAHISQLSASELLPPQIRELNPWLPMSLGAIMIVLGSLYWLYSRQIHRLRQENTRLNQLLDEQNQQRQNLEKLIYQKDEFLLNTVHELRTPLNGMIGLAESMIDALPPEQYSEVLSNLSLIIDSGYRLGELVNDLLDFSQMHFRNIELQVQPLHLGEIVESVIAISKNSIGNKNLRLINQLPKDLPPVKADINRLQQILYNLVGNAIKFTPEGTVTIKAAVITEPSKPRATLVYSNSLNGNKPPTEMLAVTVTDTGVGISPEKCTEIFQPFARLSNTPGNGLGLAISRQLVELHGGRIWIESKPGEGAAFTFTLPIATGVAPVSLTNKSPFKRQVLLDNQNVDLVIPCQSNSSCYRVLIVDDDLINLQVVSSYLKRYDYAIATASRGQEALDIIAQDFLPDLILLDVMMPEMDGYQLCKILRESFPADELPIIMLTARNQVTDLVEGLNQGANDYLTKPISKKELLARISTQLYLSHLNQAYSRFVPRQFLKLLQKKSIMDIQLGDHVQKEMSILFSDIRNFTTLSEKMNLTENFKFINSYLSRMEPAILANNGFIDKYIGDALMALFSGPADDAVRAGIEMLERLKEYNQHRSNSGYPPVRIGIGINTGSLMLGTVGGSNRMDSTVISDAVNLAYRLESLTKEYLAPLLISHHTFLELQDANQYCIRLIDRVQVKGKSEWVTVNEVFDADPPEIKEGKIATSAIFTEAWLLYNQGKFSEAGRVFAQCLAKNPGDQVAKVYLERCQSRTKVAELDLEKV